MFKKHLSQQGITLVELLVALVIASLIIGLVTSVLISTVKFNDNTQNRINLRQESNRIVSEIRADHRNDKSICYDNLLASKEINMDMHLNNTTLKKGECFAVKHTNDLPVKFTLSEGPKNTYTIDTVVEGKNSSDLSFTIPEKDSGFIDNLLLDNVFVYGSQLTVSGSSELMTSQGKEGTVVAANPPGKMEDLVLTGGGSTFAVQNVYIDKRGSNVIFEQSTKLGVMNTTKMVHITGNVQMENGGAKIEGDSIYIDGKTSFIKNSGSAFIKGKNKVIINGNVELNTGTSYIESGDIVYINGDVIFTSSTWITGKKVYINGNIYTHGWDAKIQANEIYIAGSIINNAGPLNTSGVIKKLGPSELKEGFIPSSPSISPPSLHEKNWYSKNGYDTRDNGAISSGNRIFSSNNFSANGGDIHKENVIIVSNKDIEISGNSDIAGILFAPNGKVTYKGRKFTGIIIARDGIITGGNTKIEYKNASEFLKANDPIPFE